MLSIVKVGVGGLTTRLNGPKRHENLSSVDRFRNHKCKQKLVSNVLLFKQRVCPNEATH